MVNDLVVPASVWWLWFSRWGAVVEQVRCWASWALPMSQLPSLQQRKWS